MITKLITKLKAKDRSLNTINGLEQTLIKAQEWIGKPLETASYDELEKYIAYIKENGNPSKEKRWKGREHELKSGSIELIQRRLLQFYRFCLNQTDDPKYHKIIRQLKDDKMDKPDNGIEAKDILLPEDVKRLINVATLERDRCLVAVLFESGMRIGELLALSKSMVRMDETRQEVTFDIPDIDGCKTGARPVVCVEVYGYVQDWMKCHTSDMFMPFTIDGIRKAIARLFDRAGIKKPCNPHMFRHSAITHAVAIGMQPNAISERFWGRANSAMLSTYIHLSQQMQADAYRDAKGMGNGNGTTVINPLASRCVQCGKLIQSGSMCKQCEDITKLSQENKKAGELLSRFQEENAGLTSEVGELLNVAHSQEAEIEQLKQQQQSTQDFLQKLILQLPPDIVAKVKMD